MFNAHAIRHFQAARLIRYLIICRYLFEYFKAYQQMVAEANSDVSEKTASRPKKILTPNAPSENTPESKTASGSNPFLAANSQHVEQYYFRARYYDPVMGRFLQTDPMGYVDSMNLYQGFNMNPGSYLDPMGTILHPVSSPEVNNALDILRSTPTGGVIIRLIESSPRHFFIEEINETSTSSGSISLGYFETEYRNVIVNGKTQNLEVGVIRLNTGYISTKWKKWSKDGAPISPQYWDKNDDLNKTGIANPDLQHVKRFKDLPTKEAAYASVLGHELNHGLEEELNWGRRSDGREKGKRYSYFMRALMGNKSFKKKLTKRMKKDKGFKKKYKSHERFLHNYLRYLSDTGSQEEFVNAYRFFRKQSDAYDETVANEESFITYPSECVIEDEIKELANRIFLGVLDMINSK